MICIDDLMSEKLFRYNCKNWINVYVRGNQLFFVVTRCYLALIFLVLYFTYSQDPCPYKCSCASRGSHNRRQCPDFFPPKLNRWDSRIAQAAQTHTPSTYRSTARRPRPCSLLSMDRPEEFAPPQQPLTEYHQM